MSDNFDERVHNTFQEALKNYNEGNSEQAVKGFSYLLNYRIFNLITLENGVPILNALMRIVQENPEYIGKLNPSILGMSKQEWRKGILRPLLSYIEIVFTSALKTKSEIPYAVELINSFITNSIRKLGRYPDEVETAFKSILRKINESWERLRKDKSTLTKLLECYSPVLIALKNSTPYEPKPPKSLTSLWGFGDHFKNIISLF